MDEHNAQYIADTTLNFFESLDIPLKDCRGQSYNNASNMSGKYSGVNTEVKNKRSLRICDLLSMCGTFAKFSGCSGC